MLLLKTNKITPGTRHKIFLKKIFLLKNNKLTSFSSLKNSLLIRRVNFYNRQHLNIILQKKTYIPYVFKNYFFKLHENKEFGFYRNIYNFEFISLLNSFCYPGLKYYSLSFIFLNSSYKKLIGQTIPLSLIPINFFISNIFDYKNSKVTYSLSIGSQSLRLKINKKMKLIFIKLPSTKVKTMSINTLACFGVTKSHSKELCVDGKWGVKEKLFKKIMVRGVAKNPVDHPNGGRTKAKQPEKSPWGWVAKINK